MTAFAISRARKLASAAAASTRLVRPEPKFTIQPHTLTHIQAHQAYDRGDGATAHHLSEEGKKHAAQMDAYNQQASDFIFRENNAPGRVDADTIDLHGQFVEEAERILEQRIKYAQQQGQRGLHV